MIRQNPVSKSHTAAEAGDAEFARWLTRDLRPKGASLSSPPSSAPASESEVLAGWLTRDLTPKHSLGPRASLSPFRDARGSEPPSPVPARAAVAFSHPAPVEAPPVPAAAPARAAAPAPREVPSEPPSLPVVAPASLDDDDLAVLPGRRRAAGSDRRKYLFVALGALCFLAAIVVGVSQRGKSDGTRDVSSVSSTDVNAALPPPPPSDEDLLAAEQPDAPPPVHRTGAGSDEPDDALDPLDPRNLVGGPSVRRYADVPSPTLSRLAREQRRLARERDEAVRKAKAARR